MKTEIKGNYRKVSISILSIFSISIGLLLCMKNAESFITTFLEKPMGNLFILSILILLIALPILFLYENKTFEISTEQFKLTSKLFKNVIEQKYNLKEWERTKTKNTTILILRFYSQNEMSVSSLEFSNLHEIEEYLTKNFRKKRLEV